MRVIIVAVFGCGRYRISRAYTDCTVGVSVCAVSHQWCKHFQYILIIVMIYLVVVTSANVLLKRQREVLLLLFFLKYERMKETTNGGRGILLRSMVVVTMARTSSTSFPSPITHTDNCHTETCRGGEGRTAAMATGDTLVRVGLVESDDYCDGAGGNRRRRTTSTVRTG